MSEIITGLVVIGSAAVGVYHLASGAVAMGASNAVSKPPAVGALALALRRIYERAGIPLGSDLLANHASDVNQLFAQWHEQLGQTRQALANSIPLAPVACARALEQTLSQMPLLKQVVEQVQPQSVQLAQVALKQMDTALAQGNTTLATQQAILARDHLETVLASSYDRLAGAQQSVLCEVMAETLNEMGYRVEQRDSGRRSALWANRGAESIALVLEQDGSFQMDMHGFTGLRCQQERNALLGRLAEKGVRLQVRQSVLHGDRHGGQLLKKALATAKQQRLNVPDALLRTTASRNSQNDLRRRQQIVWGQRIAR